MKYLTLLRAIIALIPILTDAIRHVEAVLPGSGHGAAKLALVRHILETGYTGANDAVTSFAELWPSLASIADTIVATYNALGIFKKS